MKKIVFLILSALTLAGCGTSANAPVKVDPAIASAIKHRSFIMYVNQMYASGLPTRILGGIDYVRINDDNMSCELPLFSREADFDLGTGLHFMESIQRYKVHRSRESTRIDVVVVNYGNRYEYEFTVYPDGAADLRVTSPFISGYVNYSGQIQPL